MYIYFHTPKTRPSRVGSHPVYKLNKSFYNVTTLNPEDQGDWEDQALFRIPFQLNYEWTSRPILLVTDYGGFIVTSSEEGEFKIGPPSSKRAYQSPIREIYLMNVPESELVISPRALRQPDQSSWDLLQVLIKYEISLYEYLGQIPLKQNYKKVSLSTISFYFEKRWIIKLHRLIIFRDSKLYTRANTILSAKLIGEETHVAVLSLRNGEYDEPHTMKIIPL